MDECVHPGALRRLGGILRWRPETCPLTCGAEGGWRMRRWACTGNGRESGGGSSTRELSGEWGMGGDRAWGDGRARSASQTRAPDHRAVGPWSLWATCAPWGLSATWGSDVTKGKIWLYRGRRRTEGAGWRLRGAWPLSAEEPPNR